MKIRSLARQFVLNRIPRQTPEWISRGYTLFFILSLLVVFGGLALVPSIISAIQEEKWISLSVLSGAYAVVLVILFKRKLSYYVRSYVLCFSVALAGYVSISSIGLVSSARLWFLCSAVLACLLIGGKSAFAVFVISFIVFVGFGYNTGFAIKIPSEPDHIVWIITSSTFVLVNILVVGATYLIVSGLKRAEASLRESEERFRLFAELAPVGIILSDRQENTLYVSPKFTELFGYAMSDVPSVNQWWPLAYPDEELGTRIRRELQTTIDEAMKIRHEIKPMEFPVTCKDGTTRHIEFRMRAADDLNVIVFSDITDRKRAEQKLRESEKRFRFMVDYSYDLIWMLKPDGVLIYVSPSWKTVLGYEPSYVIDKAFQPIVHPDDVAECENYMLRVLDAKKSLSGIQYRVKHADGSWRWHEGNITPVFAEDGSLMYFVGVSRDITERKQSEKALQAEHDQLLSLFNSIDEAIYIADLETHEILYVNRYLEELLSNDCVGAKCYKVLQGLDAPCSFCTNDIIREQKPEPHRWEYYSPFLDRHYAIVDRVIRWSDGRDVRFEMAVDISTIKKAEAEWEKIQAQLTQAQKMESVGRLAGGVAHDFNNMLGVILGHTELALLQADEKHDLYADLKEIQTAAQRSADITKQLLAFARKQTISPRRLDLNETVESMLNMLRRLIGEDIDLVWQPSAHLWPVKMDPSQIDQILANLCINARDAIDGVGKLTIETGRKSFDEEYCSEHPGFIPGDFVLLAVSDNGCGMDRGTLDNLFEPFFTTKEMGKGTGLGLATVYGIVKQNNGFINVYSEPDQGSTFRIYLPRLVDDTDIDAVVPGKKSTAGGTETILLVEDEPMILEMTTTMLERLGYTVLAAPSPGEAVNLAKGHTGPVHLLMTDVVMPEMNGRDLAEKIIALYSDIRLLFMSGYSANVIAHQGVLEDGVAFIQKPFSMADMAAKLREVLTTISEKAQR